MTERQALGMEARYGGDYLGHRLLWLAITTHNDAERQFLLTTARCAHCGQPAPDAQCQSCGAGALRDGDNR